MNLTKLQNAIFTAALLTLAAGQACADSISTSISYNMLGLQHTSWLESASTSALGSGAVSQTQWDLPPIWIPGVPYPLHHSTYMEAAAAADSFGNIYAYTNLRAGGQLDAVASWSDTFTNNSGTAQAYGFNISLSQILLSMGGWSADFSTRDFRSSYGAEVLVDGVSVWNSSQTLTVDGNGAHISGSGVSLPGTLETYNLGTYNPWYYYALDPYSGVANLGSFADGQSFTVSYVLTSSSYWNDPDGCSYECGEVRSTIYDPFALIGSPVNPIAAVPEPETYAMLLAGLGLMGGIARRRKSVTQ